MDPERILGSLVKSALFGSRMPTSTKVALGLGALGVAIAAIEHVQEKKGAAVGPPPPPPPPPPGMPPPPPPPQPPRSGEAMLLVRAMIAAAHADGTVDEEEQRAILGRLSAEDLGEEERAALTRELANPLTPEQLADQVTSPRLAEEVYAASMLAIRVDSPAEREYLARLGALLGLDDETQARLHRLLGASRPS